VLSMYSFSVSSSMFRDDMGLPESLIVSFAFSFVTILSLHWIIYLICRRGGTCAPQHLFLFLNYCNVV
jgi:hypothetical protein